MEPPTDAVKYERTLRQEAAFRAACRAGDAEQALRLFRAGTFEGAEGLLDACRTGQERVVRQLLRAATEAALDRKSSGAAGRDLALLDRASMPSPPGILAGCRSLLADGLCLAVQARSPDTFILLEERWRRGWAGGPDHRTAARVFIAGAGWLGGDWLRRWTGGGRPEEVLALLASLAEEACAVGDLPRAQAAAASLRAHALAPPGARAVLLGGGFERACLGRHDAVVEWMLLESGAPPEEAFLALCQGGRADLALPLAPRHAPRTVLQGVERLCRASETDGRTELAIFTLLRQAFVEGARQGVPLHLDHCYYASIRAGAVCRLESLRRTFLQTPSTQLADQLLSQELLVPGAEAAVAWLLNQAPVSERPRRVTEAWLVQRAARAAARRSAGRPGDAGAFLQACRRGDLAAMRREFAAPALPLPEAIRQACKRGHVGAVRWLLERGDFRPRDLAAALQAACAQGEFPAAELVMEDFLRRAAEGTAAVECVAAAAAAAPGGEVLLQRLAEGQAVSVGRVLIVAARRGRAAVAAWALGRGAAPAEMAAALEAGARGCAGAPLLAELASGSGPAPPNFGRLLALACAGRNPHEAGPEGAEVVRWLRARAGALPPGPEAAVARWQSFQRNHGEARWSWIAVVARALQARAAREAAAAAAAGGARRVRRRR